MRCLAAGAASVQMSVVTVRISDGPPNFFGSLIAVDGTKANDTEFVLVREKTFLELRNIVVLKVDSVMFLKCLVCSNDYDGLSLPKRSSRLPMGIGYHHQYRNS